MYSCMYMDESRSELAPQPRPEGAIGHQSSSNHTDPTRDENIPRCDRVWCCVCLGINTHRR